MSDPRTTDQPVLLSLPSHGQVRRLGLTGAPGTVGWCRAQTRQALHDWGWLPTGDPDQQARADDVLIVVSELVTNASRHAGGPEQLVLQATPRLLRIEVHDRTSTPPRPRRPHSPGGLGGHGLYTIALLASRWGTSLREDGSGKTVWAEFDIPAPGGALGDGPEERDPEGRDPERPDPERPGSALC